MNEFFSIETILGPQSLRNLDLVLGEIGSRSTPTGLNNISSTIRLINKSSRWNSDQTSKY